MGYRITLVEDDPQLQENYVKALERSGYDVSVCGEKQEAIDAFETSLPDLVILDANPIESVKNTRKIIFVLKKGEIFNPECHDIFTEIKLVTYHQLEVCEKEGYWKGRVIFDL